MQSLGNKKASRATSTGFVFLREHEISNKMEKSLSLMEHLSGICHERFGGAKGSRTPDLLNAIQALYQLSYGPTGGLPCLSTWRGGSIGGHAAGCKRKMWGLRQVCESASAKPGRAVPPAVRGLSKRGKWWAVRDSNPRHLRCKRSALPTELTARRAAFYRRLPGMASGGSGRGFGPHVNRSEQRP